MMLLAQMNLSSNKFGWKANTAALLCDVKQTRSGRLDPLFADEGMLGMFTGTPWIYCYVDFFGANRSTVQNMGLQTAGTHIFMLEKYCSMKV